MYSIIWKTVFILIQLLGFAAARGHFVNPPANSSKTYLVGDSIPIKWAGVDRNERRTLGLGQLGNNITAGVIFMDEKMPNNSYIWNVSTIGLSNKTSTEFYLYMINVSNPDVYDFRTPFFHIIANATMAHDMPNTTTTAATSTRTSPSSTSSSTNATKTSTANATASTTKSAASSTKMLYADLLALGSLGGLFFALL
ncbi:hypothetical protein KEM55_003436 [Ascosphaera atra]|nr:hypothetical protein KEM55_003436 [Ascosphaera atra]